MVGLILTTTADSNIELAVSVNPQSALGKAVRTYLVSVVISVYPMTSQLGFFHNTMVSSNLANKMTRHNHMTSLDIRLCPRFFSFQAKLIKKSIFYFNILLSYFNNMAAN